MKCKYYKIIPKGNPQQSFRFTDDLVWDIILRYSTENYKIYYFMDVRIRSKPEAQDPERYEISKF